MKLILLAAGGRAGSHFFHSLLDEHPQILQFPGSIRVDNNLKLILDTKDLKKKAKLFIKFYPEFFNSKLNTLERWDRLGEKKQSDFKVNKKDFINHFYKLSYKKKDKGSYSLLINLHLAYFLARKKDIKNLKVLFIHTHSLNWTKKFLDIFKVKKVDIIHTIRHPLSSLTSPIKSWLVFNSGKSFFPKDLFYQIDTVINCIYDLKKLGKVHIISLERLHLENTALMKKFCYKFKIKYKSSLKNSTINGLKWWGDKINGKYLNGINKSFKIKIYEKHFYKRDLIFFQNLTQEIIKKYNYKFYYDKKNYLFNFAPMKCEIAVWKNTFKQSFSHKFRWKHLLSIPIFYLIRILLINKIQITLKKETLPSQI